MRPPVQAPELKAGSHPSKLPASVQAASADAPRYAKSLATGRRAGGRPACRRPGRSSAVVGVFSWAWAVS